MYALAGVENPILVTHKLFLSMYKSEKGTWNIRGGNVDTKRHSIDDYLAMHKFGIIALQETKLSSRTCDTTHYKWILGKDPDKARNACGLAFLIHVSCAHRISLNILACEVSHDNTVLTVINVHITQGVDGVTEFNAFNGFISARCNALMIILGNFNAHIGKSDLTVCDLLYIGSNLYHDICNDNGDELKNLLHLGCFSMKNSWSTSSSLLTTWTNNTVSTQIDHVLCNSSTIKFRNSFGTWVHALATDHKLISTDIQISNVSKARPHKRLGATHSQSPLSKRPKM